jgi:hypothetical protein
MLKISWKSDKEWFHENVMKINGFSERLLKCNYNNGIGDVKWHWGMDQTENFGKCLEGICKCMCPEGEIEL